MTKNVTLYVVMRQILRSLASMELEEQILHLGVFVALGGVFLPWIGGEWLGGDSITHSGLGYYTGYMGITIAALHTFVLLIALVPLSGGPQLVSKTKKDSYRFFVCLQATILTLASLSVLTKTTLDFARLEIRFGVYVSLIGSLVASLYAYLRYKEQQKREVQSIFHYPTETTEQTADVSQEPMQSNAPSIRPPKQPEPEEHKLYASQLRR